MSNIIPFRPRVATPAAQQVPAGAPALGSRFYLFQGGYIGRGNTGTVAEYKTSEWGISVRLVMDAITGVGENYDEVEPAADRWVELAMLLTPSRTCAPVTDEKRPWANLVR